MISCAQHSTSVYNLVGISRSLPMRVSLNGTHHLLKIFQNRENIFVEIATSLPQSGLLGRGSYVCDLASRPYRFFASGVRCKCRAWRSAAPNSPDLAGITPHRRHQHERWILCQSHRRAPLVSDSRSGFSSDCRRQLDHLTVSQDRHLVRTHGAGRNERRFSRPTLSSLVNRYVAH